MYFILMDCPFSSRHTNQFQRQAYRFFHDQKEFLDIKLSPEINFKFTPVVKKKALTQLTSFLKSVKMETSNFKMIENLGLIIMDALRYAKIIPFNSETKLKELE